tara:strand:+ start:421 stop:1695 length:1275 start_codon:yes stop_codon:yes gene_type:complete
MNLTDNIADTDAEAGFLASCTKGEPTPLIEGLEKVRTTYFTTTRHRLIWETLQRINVDEADELTVLLAMPSADLVDAGGREAVMEVLNSTETSVHWARYLASMEKQAKLRQLRQASLETLEAIAEDPDPDDLTEKLDATLLELRHEDTETFLTGKEVLEAGLADIEARAAGRSPGIKCGIPAFDQITQGLRPNELAVLAARPSVGKTAFALTYALEASIRQQQPTIFFSLEMNAASLGTRLLAAQASVDIANMLCRTESPVQLSAIARAKEEIAKAPLWVEDRAFITVAQMRARCRVLRQQYGLGLVIIDYCQLVQPADRKVPREQQIAQISRDLKALAKDLAVPVILLAQLNREADNTEPKLSMLRESGALEQDADQVYFLHRPEPDDRRRIDAIVAKNRNGRCGTVQTEFVGEIQRFTEVRE